MLFLKLNVNGTIQYVYVCICISIHSMYIFVTHSFDQHLCIVEQGSSSFLFIAV